MLAGADHPDRIGLLPTEEAKHPSPSWTKGNFQLNYLNSAIVFLPPFAVLGAALYGIPLTLPTFVVALAFYFLNGFGITVGYHRLFSHRAFVATRAVQQIFGFLGAGALQGSIKWWGRNHRIHHNYIDTDKDPYNAKRGFLYSHFGWMIMKQDYSVLGYVDISDFHANSYVQHQHDHYMWYALTSGVFLPTIICGLINGDWVGGYFYAALAKVVFVHQSTFFINSLAHSSLFGAVQNFSENHTSHDSWLCSILALGEGYHNFHHEFAQDYRNGTKWYHWDPSKWLIRGMEMIGHAKHLVRVPNSVIERNVATVCHNKAQRQLEASKKKLAELEKNVTVPASWTWDDIEKKVSEGRKIMVVGSYVIDIERKIPTGSGYTHKDASMDWGKVHPGGYKILDAYVGKDATDAMSGQVHRHSEGAFNLLQHLRVASLKRDE